MTRHHGFGGNVRGVLIEDWASEGPETTIRKIDLNSPCPVRVGEVFEVESTRCVRLGERYPPSGSGEDYEDGGLTQPRTVVLVRLRGSRTEVISGDLAREPS